MDEEGRVKDVTAKVYKMPHEDIFKVPVLQSETGVYVVDPGGFKGSCDCSEELSGDNFIMNASNNEEHWGGSNFEKLRKGIGRESWKAFAPTSPAKNPGTLIHGCLWTGHQLLVAKKYLELNLYDDDLLRRFRFVGGSIRDIFRVQGECLQDSRMEAALSIDDFIVQGLAEGSYQFSYKPNEPLSVLVGLSPSDASLETIKIVLKSDYVEEQLAKRHLKISWYAFLNEDNAGNRGNLFETYRTCVRSSLRQQYLFLGRKYARAHEPSQLIQSQRI